MVPSYITYDNAGRIRNQPLSPELINALAFLQDMGVTARVFSGGQPEIGTSDRRTGSTRHDGGDAADVFFYRDGRQLDWANPEDIPVFQDIVRRGRQSGLTGFGAGPGYMQPGSMHIGFGAPAAWGAGGASANAPDWLRQAFGGAAPGGQPPRPDGMPAIFPGQQGMFAQPGAPVQPAPGVPYQEPTWAQDNLGGNLYGMQRQGPAINQFALDPDAFMSRRRFDAQPNAFAAMLGGMT